jgi:hypothetical protein
MINNLNSLGIEEKFIIKIKLPFDTTIPFSGHISKETKSPPCEGICISVFIAITKIWKQPKNSQADKWIN